MSDEIGAAEAPGRARLPVKRLAIHPDAVAPDGSAVRVLLATGRGSVAHFELAPGETSVAVAHRTVEETRRGVLRRGPVGGHRAAGSRLTRPGGHDASRGRREIAHA